jgi:serine/threonine protein phosphatase PrpC
MAEKKLTLEVIAKTDAGMVREANEDNFLVTPDRTNPEWILPRGEYANSDGGTVMVVADGMGGLNAGEVASNIAVDSIRNHISKAGPVKDDTSLTAIMREAVQKANTNIVRHGQDEKETEGMGSTLVMAWIRGSKLHLTWVGDSRCYIWRKGRLLQLSKDHSYVQSLVDEGRLTTEEAFYHPESNVITQSLGDGIRKPVPDDCTFPLDNEDIILLCSDGLNGMLQDGKIEEIVTAGGGLSIVADRLIEEAKAAGGLDNITVILARVVSGAWATGVEPQNGRRRKKKARALIYSLVALLVVGATFIAGSGVLRQQQTPAVKTRPAVDTVHKTVVHPADNKTNPPAHNANPPVHNANPSDHNAKTRAGKPNPPDEKTILRKLPPADSVRRAAQKDTTKAARQ